MKLRSRFALRSIALGLAAAALIAAGSPAEADDKVSLRLKWLNLAETGLGPEDCRQLLAGAATHELVFLNLTWNALGDAGAAAFQLIMTAIGNTYGAWDNNVNNLWNTPDPAGGS